jgi:PRTRC genetic system ThiF family protein
MNTLSIPSEWLARKIRIVLVGCGGTGSEMLDELFRIHCLLISLGGDGLDVIAFDPDNVSQANIGRQRFWPCDVDYPKAETLITRVNSFGGTDWRYENDEYDANSGKRFDIIITCVDTPAVRANIGKAFVEDNNEEAERYFSRNSHTSFWLDCGNDSHTGNVIFGHLELGGQPFRVPNVFELYPMLATMIDNDEPSCSTAAALEKQDYGINRSVAREASNLLWQFLRHGTLSNHGSYIDIRSGTVTPLPIDEKVWETFQISA